MRTPLVTLPRNSTRSSIEPCASAISRHMLEVQSSKIARSIGRSATFARYCSNAMKRSVSRSATRLRGTRRSPAGDVGTRSHGRYPGFERFLRYHSRQRKSRPESSPDVTSANRRESAPASARDMRRTMRERSSSSRSRTALSFGVSSAASTSNAIIASSGLDERSAAAMRASRTFASSGYRARRIARTTRGSRSAASFSGAITTPRRARHAIV